MTGVLSRLRGMGYAVRADGEEVVYLWQGNGQPPEEARLLLTELRRQKAEALALLRAKANQQSVDPDGPLPDFPFCLHSRILDTEVSIVPDARPGSVPGPAYSHSEIWILDRQRVTPEDLKAIHAVKAEFDGTIIG